MIYSKDIKVQEVHIIRPCIVASFDPLTGTIGVGVVPPQSAVENN